MASNELAIRFTEGKYATKSEVSKELKMSLIDNIWSNILKYRMTFNRYLTIRSIEKNQLVLCQCPSVSALNNATDFKLIRLMKEYSKLSIANGDSQYFEDQCLILALKSLAKEYDLEVNDAYLRSLIHGEVREVSAQNKVLINYLAALRFVKNNYIHSLDVDFLANLYSKITGVEELTSFYRQTEDNNRENRVIIDRIYTCAPTSLIEPMMESLFTFINNSSLTAVTKASIAYYYIIYIRPFSNFSDEIALLMAKAILAHGDLGEIGALLPLESILSQEQEEIARIFVEVQKTSDTTYFVNYMLKFIEEKGNDLLDVIANSKATSMRADFYRPEPERQAMVAPEEKPVEVASQPTYSPNPTYYQQDLFEQPKVEPAPAPIPQPEPKPVYEEPKPAYVAPAPVEIKPEPAPAPVVKPEPQPVVEEKVVVKPQSEQIAVAYVPPVLDERQAARLEQHLLELDPSLRKHEAHFYARHCTLGKSYTIAQYKKSIGCVYETARTSMDHLVELGYYRREQVKNKHVYSPIARKD